MQISNKALTLITKWEGFYSKAYKDPVGIWTIGYGTTKWSNGQAVKQGDTISKDAAYSLLKTQVQQHANTITQYVKVLLTQSQYDALASFQYNLGAHILKNSALLKYINNCQFDMAAKEMLLYNKAGGKVLQGLVNRRKEEAALFMAKDNVLVAPPKPVYDTELEAATKFVQNLKISDGTRPHEPATRAQVFKMIYRMRDLITRS